MLHLAKLFHMEMDFIAATESIIWHQFILSTPPPASLTRHPRVKFTNSPSSEVHQLWGDIGCSCVMVAQIAIGLISEWNEFMSELMSL